MELHVIPAADGIGEELLQNVARHAGVAARKHLCAFRIFPRQQHVRRVFGVARECVRTSPEPPPLMGDRNVRTVS